MLSAPSSSQSSCMSLNDIISSTCISLAVSAHWINRPSVEIERNELAPLSASVLYLTCQTGSKCLPVATLLCATGSLQYPIVFSSFLPRSNTQIDPSYIPHASNAVI